MAEHPGEDCGGKTFDRDVVGLDGFVEATALDGDAILRAFELGLQIAEGRRGLQIWVALGDDEQARKRGAELGLRGLELLELRGIRRSAARGELHAADAGAGLGHFEHGGFLETGRARDGVDEVRNQIGAALIDVLHLGPGRVGALLESDETIVDAARPEADSQCEHDEENDEAEKDFHDGIYETQPADSRKVAGGRTGGDSCNGQPFAEKRQRHETGFRIAPRAQARTFRLPLPI